MRKWIRVVIITLSICLFMDVLNALQILPFTYRVNLNDAYGCVTVTFDTWAMKQADKVIIKANKKEITVTDKALIKEIIKETTVASNGPVGCANDRTIEVYKGDRLIRSMSWGTCCDSVKVYDADAGHWLLLTGSKNPSGFVSLSDELLSKLNTLINES